MLILLPRTTHFLDIIIIICFNTGSIFQFGWESVGGIGFNGFVALKNALNCLCRVEAFPPKTSVHRSDPLTGSSFWDLNFISTCGDGEILWSKYSARCDIVSSIVKLLKVLYLPPPSPAFRIIAFVLVQLVRSLIVTAFGWVVLVLFFGKNRPNQYSGWLSKPIPFSNRYFKLGIVLYHNIDPYKHNFRFCPS